MAAPIIDGVNAPREANPGVPFTVEILAHDPDAKDTVFQGEARDAAGNVAQVTVTVPVADPLSYSLIDVDGIGAMINQVSPGVFQVVIP